MKQLLTEVGPYINNVYGIVITESTDSSDYGANMVCFLTPGLLLEVFPDYDEEIEKNELIFHKSDMQTMKTIKPGVYTGEITTKWEGHGFFLLVHEDMTCDYYCTYGGYHSYNIMTLNVDKLVSLIRSACDGDVEIYTRLMTGKASWPYIEDNRRFIEHIELDNIILTQYPSLSTSDFSPENTKDLINTWSEMLSYPSCVDVWMGEGEEPYNPTYDMGLILAFTTADAPN